MAVAQPSRGHNSEARSHVPLESVVSLSLCTLSLGFTFWYYAHYELLLYGDAVAHMNIARRVVDNRWWLTSFIQLGTVWLPLQHVAMLPFVWNNRLWQSGIAGTIPSMVAYVLGGVGIFRLANGFGLGLPQNRGKDGVPTFIHVPAYIAAAIYALNPNLLYMQSIAMNEPVFLAFFVWALVYLGEMLRVGADERSGETGGSGSNHLVRTSISRERALERCGICLAGGALTRYDGWFTAGVIGAIVCAIVFRWLCREADRSRRRTLAKSLIEFLLLNALVPVFWLAYNQNSSGRAMDWANGPYSAKAIAQRTTEPGAPPYPGKDRPWMAARYFLKAAQLNVGNEPWGKLMLILALMGTAVAACRVRQYGVLLLLWLPLIFYALSIAYGSIPIFIPVWWPFSYYNVRYGLELLPVVSVFPVLLATFVGRLRMPNRELAAYVILIACVSISYVHVWADVPITLREARANSGTRVAMERALANFLETIPKSSTLLMYESAHVGALQRAGIPLKNVISENSHPDWEWALLDPVRKADYIIEFRGDPVWLSAKQHRDELDEVMAIAVPGQARCTIYVPKREQISAQITTGPSPRSG